MDCSSKGTLERSPTPPRAASEAVFTAWLPLDAAMVTAGRAERSRRAPSACSRATCAAGGNVVEEKRRAKPIPVPGLEDEAAEVVEVEEEVEEDVLEDTSDLEDGAETIDVEVDTETGEEER